MEMGYLTVLYVRLGAKIGDLHAKDSYSFRKRQIRYSILVYFNSLIIIFGYTAINLAKGP